MNTHQCRLDDTDERVTELLIESLGPAIQELMQAEDVTDILLNPDGRLVVERIGKGRQYIGRFPAANAQRIIRIISSYIGAATTRQNPIVSAEMPRSGFRFEGILPPVTASPVFAIRKQAVRIFSLADYVAAGIMPPSLKTALKGAIARRRNILICGGTGSGKTTLVNACIAELSRYDRRVVIIEDTRELQTELKDCVPLKTSPEVTMTTLLKSTLRLRPDSIIVGEVRDGAALVMLKAWNTGHPGGLCTVHANGALEALVRIEQLIQEVLPQVPHQLIAQAIDYVVYIAREGTDRRVESVIKVTGYRGGDYMTEEI